MSLVINDKTAVIEAALGLDRVCYYWWRFRRINYTGRATCCVLRDVSPGSSRITNHVARSSLPV